MHELMTERGTPIEIGYYPDGMPYVKDATFFPDTLILRPRTLASFMAVMFYVDACRDAGTTGIRLELPYMPGARQDRMLYGPGTDSIFGAKRVAELLNARLFRSVTLTDPHSDVAPALIDRCRVRDVGDVLQRHSPKFTQYVSAHVGSGGVQVQGGNRSNYAGVIAPDVGAVKRAEIAARVLGVPVYQGFKHRDLASGKLTGFSCEVLPKGRLLLVDDICDGGGTFLGLAEHIAESYRDVSLDLYVTHGLFTQGTDALVKAFGTVYCTDSILGEKPGVTVLPMFDTPR